MSFTYFAPFKAAFSQEVVPLMNTVEIALNEISNKIFLDTKCYLELDSSYSTKFSLDKDQDGNYYIRPHFSNIELNSDEEKVGLINCYSDSLLRRSVGKILIVVLPIPPAKVYWDAYESGDTILWSKDVFLASKFHGLSKMSGFSFLRFQIKEFSISNLDGKSQTIQWNGKFNTQEWERLATIVENNPSNYFMLHDITVLSPDGRKMKCSDHFFFSIYW